MQEEGNIDLTPTLDSLWIKAKKQAARAKSKPDKQTESGKAAQADVTRMSVPGAVDEQDENDYNDMSAHLSLIFDDLNITSPT